MLSDFKTEDKLGLVSMLQERVYNEGELIWDEGFFFNAFQSKY